MGTISYIAPEIHEGKPYDKAVDIWSLGIILYFMLSGTLPFEGEDDKDRVRKIIKCKLEFKDDAWLIVSPEAIDLISKMVVKNPNKRINIKSIIMHEWLKGIPIKEDGFAKRISTIDIVPLYN